MPSFLSGTSGKPGSVVNAKAAPMPDWYKGAAPSNGLLNFVVSTACVWIFGMCVDVRCAFV